MRPFARTSIILAAAIASFAAPAFAKQCYGPDELSQRRSFSRSVSTEGGKMLWLGGQTGNPKSDFEGQVREVFDALDKTIKANGGQGLKDMVTMTVFITEVRYGQKLTDMRKDIFKECFPASALITVSSLAAPGLMLEIQGVAIVGGK
jgi:enamine deaminase RidA (YjgF/YER057c/UK114 family)